MLRSGVCRLVYTRNSGTVHRHSCTVHRHLFHTFLRLETSVFDNNEYSRLLYTRLSLNKNYQYLDPGFETEPEPDSSGPLAARLISTLQNREENPETIEDLEGEAINRFKDWAQSVQLRVGFIMHLNNNINSRQYLNRVIQHMAAGDLRQLQPHEVVTLLLLIYFRKDLTVEDLSEYLDLDELQTVFGDNISKKELKAEEICAGCLGLKKISGLRVRNKLLRSSLYNILDADDSDPKFKDFFLMTLLTTLAKGNELYHDSPGQLQQALADFLKHCGTVSVMTAVKMMTFGINIGFENSELTAKVCDRVLENLESLNIKDMVAITNFASKSTDYNIKLLLYLKGEISRFYESATSLEDLVDVLNGLSYLSINEVYRLEVITPFLDALEGTHPDQVNLSSLPDLAERMVRNLAATHPNEEKLLSDLDRVRSDPRVAATLCRIPAFLCFNLRLDQVEQERPMNMDLAAAILKLFRKKIPLQLSSPQMPVDSLDNRSRLLVHSYRALVKLLGTERYAAVARILPQFPEPDVVFGNLAGTPVSVPEYITDPSILRPKRAPAGDWFVLVMANRKNLSADNKLTGVDEIKARQLKMLGFTPIVVPYSGIRGTDSVLKILPRLLKFENVKLPNLDDGFLEKNKKF